MTLAIVMLLCANVMANSIGTTYESKAMWRGYQLFDSGTGVVRTTANTDIGPLDFSGAFWLPDDSGNQEQQRVDGALVYSGELNPFKYEVGYAYYWFPEQSTHDADNSADLQEVFATAILPNLLGLPVNASYTAVQTWSSNSGQINLASGGLHIVGLALDFAPVNLIAEAIYNDGVEYQGVIDHDWSHAVFGASIDIPLADNMTLTPGVYYELAFDDDLIEDETWFAVGLSMKF